MQEAGGGNKAGRGEMIKVPPFGDRLPPAGGKVAAPRALLLSWYGDGRGDSPNTDEHAAGCSLASADAMSPGLKSEHASTRSPVKAHDLAEACQRRTLHRALSAAAAGQHYLAADERMFLPSHMIDVGISGDVGCGAISPRQVSGLGDVAAMPMPPMPTQRCRMSRSASCRSGLALGFLRAYCKTWKAATSQALTANVEALGSDFQHPNVDHCRLPGRPAARRHRCRPIWRRPPCARAARIGGERARSRPPAARA